MALSPRRSGELLRVNGRVVEFSYFPMRRTTRRWGSHSMLYAADPWAVIGGAIRAQVSDDGEREAALSFLRQANEYYEAAQRSSAAEPRPLLYYYAFLNLGKALAIARGEPRLVGRVEHGISPVDASGFDIRSAEVSVFPKSATKVNALAEFHHALTGGSLTASKWRVDELAAQSVVAHRLWRQVGQRKERFLSVDDIQLLHDPASKSIWLTLRLREDHLTESLLKTLSLSGLDGDFQRTSDKRQALGDASPRRFFDQADPITYTDRAADKVMETVGMLKPHLWRTVGATPPYRRYYLYLSDGLRVPQLVSIYSVMFWLGSLTRYRPVELLELLDGPYGPFIREFLATQPAQFVYEVASEFQKQEVSRAAVV